MKPAFAAFLSLALASPVLAADRVVFETRAEKFILRASVALPDAAGREKEAQCTPEQVAVLTDRLQRHLEYTSADMVAAYKAAHTGYVRLGTVLEHKLRGSCGPDGGVTITRYDPADPVATEHYEPGKGWQIVG